MSGWWVLGTDDDQRGAAWQHRRSITLVQAGGHNLEVLAMPKSARRPLKNPDISRPTRREVFGQGQRALRAVRSLVRYNAVALPSACARIGSRHCQSVNYESEHAVHTPAPCCAIVQDQRPFEHTQRYALTMPPQGHGSAGILHAGSLAQAPAGSASNDGHAVEGVWPVAQVGMQSEYAVRSPTQLTTNCVAAS
jgi:hypothetical protein